MANEEYYRKRLEEATRGRERERAKAAAQSESSFRKFIDWLLGGAVWEAVRGLFDWFRSLFGF